MVINLPDRLDINIGTKCNQRCTFCYYRRRLDRPNKPLRYLQKQLDRYKRYGIRKLHITGGEPLLHQDINALTVYAKQSGFDHISIITNGVCLDANKFNELKRCGADEFVVSLHGAAASTHNDLVGVDAFWQVDAALRLLSEERFPFSVNFVVNGKNYVEMEDFAAYICRYRPRLATFLYYNR